MSGYVVYALQFVLRDAFMPQQQCAFPLRAGFVAHGLADKGEGAHPAAVDPRHVNRAPSRMVFLCEIAPFRVRLGHRVWPVHRARLSVTHLCSDSVRYRVKTKHRQRQQHVLVCADPRFRPKLSVGFLRGENGRYGIVQCRP